MRRIATLALTMSAVFLAIVAVLINSPALFYMSTALIGTLGLARLQAYWSVRSLRFERFAPPVAKLGQTVRIEIVAWSERKVRRPLIYVRDILPSRLHAIDVGPSLPIAPEFSRPIRTGYSFVARRRGVYRWQQLIVYGTDAMGLITMNGGFSTPPVEMTVAPIPIPLNVELPTGGGWGMSEMSSGQNRGSGVEPYGVREYRPGDSLRHVHWASTARRGQLLVKEFESGSQGKAVIFIPSDADSDVEPKPIPKEGVIYSTVDWICGHALSLLETFVRQGASARFPQWEGEASRSAASERVGEAALAMARWRPSATHNYADDLRAHLPTVEAGAMVIAFVAVANDDVAAALGEFVRRGATVAALVYATEDWDPKFASTSAQSPGFLSQLNGLGVHAVRVPSLTGREVGVG
jgi:uncharacterized protein (DUF58 family)